MQTAPENLLSERELQAAVIRMAELWDWLVYHVTDVRGKLRSSSSPGFPDLVLVGHGRTIFAELKTARGKISPQQKIWLEQLGQCSGVESYVWRPADWKNDTIANVLRP